jgi:hypothetical protein
MDRDHVLRLLDRERRHLAHDGISIDVRPALTRASAADGSHHAIAFSSLPVATADAIIDGEIEHHRQRGVGFEWKAYAHDGPPDLLDRLARHGFTIGEREAVVVYELARRAAWLEASAHRVVRIEHPEQVDVYRAVAERIFGKDYAFTADELATALASGSTQHRAYLAYAGDEPVSIGRLYTHPDSAFGALYGGGTLPAHRGRGFYRALVAARGRDAVAAGAAYLLVDALPTSLPILERLGFERVIDTWPCCWSP